MKGWRTLLANALIVLAGIIAYLDMAGLAAIIPPKYSWVPIAIGVLNIVLRYMTTTPVGKKEEA